MPRYPTSQRQKLTDQATISTVFFLPAFVSPFMQTSLGGLVLGIDIVFSYLYVPPTLDPEDPANRQQMAHVVHLRGARLQLAQLLPERASRHWLLAEVCQRGIHLPRLVCPVLG